MNIWNKVFLGVIIATAIGVVVLASVEMKIRGVGQRHIDSLKQRIEKTDADIARIHAGTAPTKATDEKSPSEWSFEELRNILRERYQERGRAWFGCIISDLSERTLPPALLQVIAQIIITGPLTTGETGAETETVPPEHLRGIVYVFEEGNNGTFLGRFTVDSVPTPTPFRDDEGNQKNGYRVTLVSSDHISDEEIEQIFEASEAASARWAIYLTPPVDRISGIFDKLTDEEKQMIPEEFAEKFQPRPMAELTDEEKEGADPNVVAIWEKIRATIDNPEAEAAQDFALMLDWLYQRRSGLLRDIKVAESDIATYNTAEEQTKAENEKLTADCVLEETRVGAMNIQRDAVMGQLEQYQAEINSIELQIEKIQALNEAYVAKIAEYQTKAVEEMEKQSATAAQVRNETDQR